MSVLDKLYELPIVTVKKVQDWTGFSRPSATDLIDKLVKLDILFQRDKDITYGRIFEYKEYLKIFT